jgi:lipopolysaccharide transport system ATP-binding protein
MSYKLELKDVVFTRLMERDKRARFALHRTERNVIDHLSLSIAPGERVGLLGENGAGKTTLLRIMGGIFQPDFGSVTRNGDVSCFLDGFYGLDPYLTGRENANSRSVMAGMSKAECASNVETVENFADIGQYFDQPVKTYSTGMILRLVFAIGTSQTHQILLIDEGLGTADINFQQKAFQRLEQMYANAPIIVIASHNLDILRQQCTRGVVMSGGHIVFDGNIESAIAQYSSIQSLRD